MTEAVDSDVHNAIPDISALFPYLPDRWRDYCVEHGVTSLEPNLYPPGMPLSSRPDSRVGSDPPGSDPSVVGRQVLGNGESAIAILNCLYSIQPIRNEDWAVAMARALNDWQAGYWLAADSRFHASIVVPSQSPQRAVNEIERLSEHPGFVQVLLLVYSQAPLGQRFYWPIYEAATQADMPVAIHPGIAGANPLSPTGWPSYYVEDYAGVSPAFQSQVVSLICEGVFQKYPSLRVVLLESGVSWLPSLMWRLDKNWKGLRREVPWVSRPPSAVIRDHVQLSTQPLDLPHRGDAVERLLERIGSVELLLYASDYPHYHYSADSQEMLLQHLSPAEREAVLRNNALRTYPLLSRREEAGHEGTSGSNGASRGP